ncbi:phosphotransferase [Paenibacillus ehimensis]|uniref:phosphotransferase n=1 Tax=Paenibacillus ehimensis TaxID=79264 RepID=UPI000FDA2FC4|nr:phosphotransferase [Paenibacillus ehimensis]MEC0212396.1 phosphotransferase [Paenibacillus ehimensis]
MTGKEKERIVSILRRYGDQESWSVKEIENGLNNTTRFARYGSQDVVLRIYENHADRNKVAYEHEVLRQLQNAGLSFAVPVALAAQDGNTYIDTGDGKLAALFRYIEGGRAELALPAHARAIGQAAGELVTALERVTVPWPPSYAPYYNLDAIHPLVTRKKLEVWLSEVGKGELESAADGFREEMALLKARLPDWLQQLPQQHVHSDIVCDNVLVSQDRVTAILDFEFVMVDFRALELAVLLYEWVDMTENGKLSDLAWEAIEACLDGYGRSASLTEAEIQALPQLIVLRCMVLTLHFLGRYWSGLEQEDATRYLVEFAQTRSRLRKYGPDLIKLAEQYIGTENRE